MKKYDIDKCFGIFRYFKTPFNPFVFLIVRILSKILPKGVKNTNEFLFKKVKIVDKNSKINCYYFNSLKEETDKIMLYIHGGGFCFKGLSRYFRFCKRYAISSNIKILYVDYRTSPKYKYPIPLNDCKLAYNWIIENKDTLAIDESKIIIGGDSAGGLLSLDLVKSLITNGNIPLATMLIYPVVDNKMNTESMKKYTDTPMWNAKLSKKMWKYYLDNNEYQSILESDCLKSFPKTYIETVEYDCLKDEALNLYKKLKEARCEVFLNETKKTMHGFDNKNCEITKNVISSRIKFLKDC